MPKYEVIYKAIVEELRAPILHDIKGTIEIELVEEIR